MFKVNNKDTRTTQMAGKYQLGYDRIGRNKGQENRTCMTMLIINKNKICIEY